MEPLHIFLFGVLITHNRSYKYHSAGPNRAETTWWYVCSSKSSGCPARATVRHITVQSEDGAPVNVTQVAELASPHGHNHPAEHAKIMADILLEKMKTEVASDPLSPTGC